MNNLGVLTRYTLYSSPKKNGAGVPLLSLTQNSSNLLDIKSETYFKNKLLIITDELWLSLNNSYFNKILKVSPSATLLEKYQFLTNVRFSPILILIPITIGTIISIQ